MRPPEHRLRCTPVTLALTLVLALAACSRRETTPASDSARIVHKKAIAAAAQDRLVLQYLIKGADTVAQRLPSLRRVTRGGIAGDTNVIWFAYFAGDSLIALDETRRVGRTLEENARYLFRDTSLHYVTLDRIDRSPSVPLRLRLAFGFDSTGRLIATSKNLNDAAVPLDTATDIGAPAARARMLRLAVLDTVAAAKD
jgi:hypothetical protein